MALSGRRIAEPVVGPWGVAVAFLDEPRIVFLDPSSGQQVGEVAMPAHGQAPDATPLLRGLGEQLLLASRDGRYRALGRPWRRWELVFEHSGAIDTIAPTIASDAVYFVDAGGELCCHGLVRGERRWSTPWRHRRRDLLSVAVSSRGLVAVGSSEGRLGILAPGGQLLWSKIIGRRIETGVAWLDDRTILSGMTGELVALRPTLVSSDVAED